MIDPLTVEEIRAYNQNVVESMLFAELAGRPLYVVLTSQKNHHKGINELVIVADDLDLALRSEIDDWRGRAPCMLVEDRVALYGDDLLYQSAQLGLILQGAAHRLLIGLIPKVDFYATTFSASELSDAESNECGRVDAEVIALCLHLHHRAELMGHRVSPSMVLDTKSHGLSPMSAYRDAMADDLEACENLSFTEIAALPVPYAVQKLYASDKGWPEPSQAVQEFIDAKLQQTDGGQINASGITMSVGF